MATAESILFCNLASGSRGNCSYVGDRQRGVLIDAGLSLKQIRLRMGALGLGLASIDALLLTHEHSDHVQQLDVVTRHLKLTVWASRGTLGGARHRWEGPSRVLEPGVSTLVGCLNVLGIPVSHDARQPLAFRIENEAGSVGLATDLGKPENSVAKALAGVDLLFLEANHDPTMLSQGPYPAFLKKRVASNRGHLSNLQAARFLGKMAPALPTQVMLGHLSENNNTPELAAHAVASVLEGRAQLHLAQQRNPRSMEWSPAATEVAS